MSFHSIGKWIHDCCLTFWNGMRMRSMGLLATTWEPNFENLWEFNYSFDCCNKVVVCDFALLVSQVQGTALHMNISVPKSKRYLSYTWRLNRMNSKLLDCLYFGFWSLSTVSWIFRTFVYTVQNTRMNKIN